MPDSHNHLPLPALCLESITGTSEIATFLYQSGKLPYSHSPGHWTLAEKSLPDKGTSIMNSKLPSKTQAGLTWSDPRLV